jgi:HD-GYP domain-containing protein (c-di-GMP phosphodiesterase class II)/flagellar basal body-associated protein FliL
MADQPAQRSKPDLDREAAEAAPRRKVNLMVALGVIVIVAVIAAGVFFSFRFVEDERQRALNEWQIRLGIVADSRVAAINDWIQGNFFTIRELTENASLQLYLTELAQAQGDAAKVTDAAASQGYLRNLLVAVADKTGFGPPLAQVQDINSNVERTGVAGLALTDADGKPMVITPAMPPLTGKIRTGVATALNGQASVIDMYKGATNLPTVGFALPIYGVQADADSKGIGVAVGIRVVGDDLFSLLRQPGDTSKTAETYIVRKGDNVIEYLTPLQDGTRPLDRTMAIDTPELADSFAAATPGGFAIKRDYAGNEVLVVSRAIADVPWVLVRKITRAEALEANETRLRNILIVFILIIIGVTVAMIAVWRHGTSLRAAAAAEKFRISSERFENISKFMRVITNSQPTLIVAVDGTTTYTFANEPAAKAAGITPEEMLGKTMAGVMGPVKAKFYADVNKEILKTFAELEEQKIADSVRQARRSFVQRFDSGDHGMEVLKSDHIPLRGDRDHPPGVLMIIDDITEFSREQLKSEARLKQLVHTLATIVDRRDPASDTRSSDVGEVARAIAEELELDRREVDTAAFAGTLKNVGTLFDGEKSIINSAMLLQGIDFEGPVVDAIRQSEERYDGKGPQGLGGEDILLPARIVAVAAAFVDLTCPRDEGAGLTLEEATARLLQESGTVYDRRVVSALLNHLENHGGAIKWAHFLRRN